MTIIEQMAKAAFEYDGSIWDESSHHTRHVATEEMRAALAVLAEVNLPCKFKDGRTVIYMNASIRDLFRAVIRALIEERNEE